MFSNIGIFRWTPFVYLFPNQFIDLSDQFKELNIGSWDEEYTYQEDGWTGIIDYAQLPTETIRKETGDCEDYALVCASWAIANGRPEVHIAFMFEEDTPWPTHVVTYDTRNIYTSGDIKPMSMEEYIESSEYESYIDRKFYQPADTK